MRYILLILGLAVASVMIVAGKRGDMSRKPPIEMWDDMDRQYKLRPQTSANLSPDGRSSRLPVEGTIARGQRFADVPENTGRKPGTTNYVDTIPVAVTPALIERGQERFNINCSPCHGKTGDGNGITKKIGAMPIVATLHDPRIVGLVDGEIFGVISYGKGLMSGYAANVPVEDRWAIVAYVRALQLARLGTADDVPAEHKADLLKK
ncbi:MAG: cytochrome c [Verrucomicrobia bacterium]|nr:cytochrome c [Verrucomicrobiota bacterium]